VTAAPTPHATTARPPVAIVAPAPNTTAAKEASSQERGMGPAVPNSQSDSRELTSYKLLNSINLADKKQTEFELVQNLPPSICDKQKLHSRADITPER
jgi:hypothetical protein